MIFWPRWRGLPPSHYKEDLRRAAAGGLRAVQRPTQISKGSGAAATQTVQDRKHGGHWPA